MSETLTMEVLRRQPLEAQFLQGVEEFNRREFFECHDTLEALWMRYRQPDRLFYQGIIQMAVGCHHFQTGNYAGARNLWTKGRDKLAAYQPVHRGIQVARLLADIAPLEAMAREAAESGEAPERPRAFPRIHLKAPPGEA